jgi:hypothetical protein
MSHDLACPCRTSIGHCTCVPASPDRVRGFESASPASIYVLPDAQRDQIHRLTLAQIELDAKVSEVLRLLRYQYGVPVDGMPTAPNAVDPRD